MTLPPLKVASQSQAAGRLASVLSNSETYTLEVKEDTCFANWLKLGQVTCYIEPDMLAELEPRLALSQFIWKVPSKTEISKGLIGSWNGTLESPQKDGDCPATKALFEGLQDIVRRLLLLWPVFDHQVTQDMMTDHGTTLIVDTTGVNQGGLDFVSRFLYPRVRIKIPSVVPLEILNQCDKFMSLRRKKLVKHQLLQEHLKSQGALRALHRLEWSSGVVVERPQQEQDPLRNIFETDPELKQYNVHSVQRSFADRLVLESAKKFRSHVGSQNKVCLLTSDIGLTRSSLSEGVGVWYFDARRTSEPFAKVLTGVRFEPFSSKLLNISLIELLWELAAGFGRCRLTLSNESICEIVSIGTEIDWSPFMAMDDLMYCSIALQDSTNGEVSESARQSSPERETQRRPSPSHGKLKDPEQSVDVGGKQTRPVIGYSINPENIIPFVRLLVGAGQVDEAEAMKALEMKNPRYFGEFIRFLESGGFVENEKGRLTSTQRTKQLWAALSSANIDQLDALLMEIPSYRQFLTGLGASKGDANWWRGAGITKAERVGPAYLKLAQITGAAFVLQDHGPIVTDCRPSVEKFVPMAIGSYRSLSAREPLVLSGEWLESLAKDHHVHPVRSKELLKAAQETGLIKRYFEGSSPDWRFEKHTLEVLEVTAGEPRFETVHLYHGDFLSKDRASVRLRIESVGSQNESEG